MPDTKISSMPAATSVGVSDLIPIVQGGVNKKATASLLKTTPGGSSHSVQYNTGSGFGGDSNLTWDSSNEKLNIGSQAYLDGANGIWYLYSPLGLNGQPSGTPYYVTTGTTEMAFVRADGWQGAGQGYYYGNPYTGITYVGGWAFGGGGQVDVFSNDGAGTQKQWIQANWNGTSTHANFFGSATFNDPSGSDPFQFSDGSGSPFFTVQPNGTNAYAGINAYPNGYTLNLGSDNLALGATIGSDFFGHTNYIAIDDGTSGGGMQFVANGNFNFNNSISATNLNLSGQTASTIAAFDGSKNLISLSLGTYPSFTELSYVKGVTSAIQTQLNAKAPLASPALTGTPTAPTASLGTNTTQVATTAFVANGLSNKQNIIPAQLRIGFIGDSITASVNSSPTNPAVVAQDIMQFTNCPTTVNNQGIGGTASGNWVSGSANLTAAISSLTATKMNYCHIMLGTNDSKDTGGYTHTATSTFYSNILGTCQALMTAGITPILSYAIYPNYAVAGSPWTSNSPTYVSAYNGQIDLIVGYVYNGLTVLRGDVAGYTFFQSNTGELADGIHPTVSQGYNDLARLWSVAIVNSIWGSSYLSVIGGGTLDSQTLPAVGGGNLSTISDSSWVIGGGSLADVA